MSRAPVRTAAVTTGDLAARRIIAVSRVGAAVLTAALISVDVLRLPSWAAWAAGLVWLPLSAWIWLAEEGPVSVSRNRVAFGADLCVVACLLWLAPAHGATIVVFTAPFAAAVAYRSGSGQAFAFGAAVLAMRWTSTYFSDTSVPNRAIQVSEVALYVSFVVLITRARAVHHRDAVTVRRFALKGDMILAMSSEGVVVTDHAGLILQTNPAAQRVVGDSDGVPMIGLECASMSLHAESGPLDCTRTCALAELCGGDDQGVPLWRHHGDQRQALLGSATRIDGQGSTTEYLHSFRDITRLRQADEAKTMFLATASHELKTPLTVIRGFTQILQATVEDPGAQTALNAIETRSRDLSSIVDRLLLSSRIESGRVDLTFTEVDIAPLLKSRLSQLGASLGCPITVSVPDHVTLMTSGDALGTIVEHLLDNASKYSSTGPVNVTVDQAADSVRIIIADRGIGMSADQVESCFDKFWQAEATDIRRFGGSGIGLYIVQSLVHGLGGTISVDSAFGVGTTFTVTLPIEQVDLTHGSGADATDDPHTSVDDFIRHLGLPAGAA